MSEVENMTETEVTEEAVEETAKKDTKVKDDKKKASKDRKPGLGSKIANFFKSNKSEFKKISWYGKKQTIKSSVVVIICLIVAAVVLGVLDYGISNLLMWIGSLINL